MSRGFISGINPLLTPARNRRDLLKPLSRVTFHTAPTTKPRYGSIIDAADPINANLILCYLFNEGYGSTVHNLASNGATYDGAIGSVGTGVFWELDEYGNTVLRIASDKITTTGFGNIAPTTEATFVFMAYTTTQNNSNSIFSINYGGATNKIQSHFLWGDARIFFDYGDLSSGGRVVYTPSSPGNWYNWALRSSAADDRISVYKAGTEDAFSASHSTFSQTNVDLLIGNGAGQWTGRMGYFYAWDRALSATELSRLNSDPYCGILRLVAG